MLLNWPDTFEDDPGWSQARLKQAIDRDQKQAIILKSDPGAYFLSHSLG